MPAFDERATDWDTPERIGRAEAAAALIIGAVTPAPHARVLDVGAGTGLLGLALLPAVGSVTLADTSEGMLRVADAKVAAAGITAARTLRLALTRDPVPDERFDLVVSLMALHHVSDTGEAMKDLARLLDPGGRIALIDLEAEDGSFHDDPDVEVHHGFDRGRLRQLAADAGFRDVVFHPAGDVVRDGRTYPLFLLVATRG